MSTPTAPTAARPTWQRAYYALGGFNVLSVLAAIGLSYAAMSGFTRSVDANQEWAERSARYSELAQTVTAADAPGNDVFESRDVPREEARLRAVVATFERQHAAAVDDLQRRVAPAVAAPMLAKLARARELCNAMVAEAGLIFEAFRAARDDAAGRHMAAMDRNFSQCNETLASVLTDVRRVQAAQFAAQTRESQGLKRFEHALAALVALIVALIVAYGARLGAVFARQQGLVDGANRDMRLLLENVEQGFLTLDAAGKVRGERSAPVDAWLGAVPDGTPFHEVLARADASAGAWFAMGWESVVEDVLPLEVSIDQLPCRVALGRRTLRVTYKPILRGATLERVLVVVTDVTALVEQEQSESLQREVLNVLDAVMRDRNGFMEFVTEAESLVGQVTSGAERDVTVITRMVHTLKGNFGIYGLASLVDCCHRLESRLVNEDDAPPTDDERGELAMRWGAFTAKIQPLVARRDAGVIEITEAERQVLLESIRAFTPHRDLGRMVTEWTYEPMARRFDRIGAHVVGLAKRLGKAPVRVEATHNELRLPVERWAPFWASFVHAVRNAVDHGLETDEERADADKAPVARVSLSSRVEGEHLVIELADDGRGVDLERVRAKAMQAGIPHAMREDLMEALFHDGLSTRDAVSDTSGRGVGLASVRNAARALGGEVTLESTAGVGTTLRVRVRHERRWGESMVPARRTEHPLALRLD
jgi:two-component system chemotaxis sensor kinase CheA